ncbi:MAG TPA: thermonuclease family protein [Dehalococcoidia bacterium]|nr:thermonuclease family protein [Dehalococcoidia bacterium]
MRTILPLALVLALAAGCSAGPSSSATTRPSATARPATALAAPSSATSPTAVAALPTAAPGRCAPPYPSGAPTADTVLCADPAGMQPARVLRIVDGDTLHVELSGGDVTIRLFGVDTPERGEPCFSEASRALARLAGTTVLLLPDARDRDRYGRTLRYVYTPDGMSIDATLVAEGFGHAWRQDGALRDAIVALEDRARAGRVGCLWR